MQPRTRATIRFGLILAGLLVLLAGLSFLHPRVRYIATAARYQGELLWGRVPTEQAIADGDFTDAQILTLRKVPAIKAHALSMGLADTGHYSTITPTWNHTVWNVSACEPLSFTPRKWWFPIVGTVPYLGFFEEEKARAWEAELDAEGMDTYVRTAGAWSTLGWFEDPLLPDMANWTEARLSNTLHHELTHATVWVPGTVAFNESLASFVGDEGGLAYLIETYGADSVEVAEERVRREDRATYIALMKGVYDELDALYSDTVLPDEDKLARKAAILESIPDRARRAPFSDPERWATHLGSSPWNNARLVQFRVYNRSHEWFRVVLDQEQGDWGRFLSRVEALGDGGDPYRALAEAAGVDPESLGDEPVR